MSKVRVTGCKELIEKLEKAGTDTNAICAKCVYKGMGVVDKAFESRLNSLQTQGGDSWSNKNAPKRYLRDWEKKALIDNYGLAPLKYNGGKVDGRAGFDGYAMSPKKPYRQVAVAKIANATNCGTSFEKAQPIFKPVISQSRSGAIAIMQTELEEQIKERGLT